MAYLKRSIQIGKIQKGPGGKVFWFLAIALISISAIVCLWNMKLAFVACAFGIASGISGQAIDNRYLIKWHKKMQDQINDLFVVSGEVPDKSLSALSVDSCKKDNAAQVIHYSGTKIKPKFDDAIHFIKRSLAEGNVFVVVTDSMRKELSKNAYSLAEVALFLDPKSGLPFTEAHAASGVIVNSGVFYQLPNTGPQALFWSWLRDIVPIVCLLDENDDIETLRAMLAGYSNGLLTIIACYSNYVILGRRFDIGTR